MDTKDRIVAAARELFWQQGYHATSVGEILSRAGAGSGSLYHFFEGKQEVLQAVLEDYLSLLDPVILEPARARAGDPIERVFAILDGYRQGLIVHDYDFGCPIGRLALETGTLSETVRGLILENFDRWCAAIEECFDEAGDRLPPAADRTGLARFVLTTMEGAVMQAAVARSLQPFDDSVAHLRAYLDSLLASRSYATAGDSA